MGHKQEGTMREIGLRLTLRLMLRQARDCGSAPEEVSPTTRIPDLAIRTNGPTSPSSCLLPSPRLSRFPSETSSQAHQMPSSDHRQSFNGLVGALSPPIAGEVGSVGEEFRRRRDWVGRRQRSSTFSLLFKRITGSRSCVTELKAPPATGGV
jgi:hypothetical protein